MKWAGQDSCSDLCQLITTAPSLSFISLAENLFSLRCVGALGVTTAIHVEAAIK